MIDKETALHDYLKNSLSEIHKELSQNNKVNFLDTIKEQENKRAQFIEHYRQIPLGTEPFFVVLRKWNSYTPSLPSGDPDKMHKDQFSIGGGYFLFVPGKTESNLDKGYGLVIDPGYNFIHNFGSAGFYLDDIDGILITHAHNDHTNDFESLLALLYERNKKFRDDRKQKLIDLFLNIGAFKKFSNYLDLAHEDKNSYIGNVTVMSPGQTYKIPGRENNLELEIVALFTDHHEIVTKRYAVGICFKASERNIYISGDTGWRFETAERNNRILQKNGIDVTSEDESQTLHILVTHLGSMKPEEFQRIDDIEWKKAFYESHLGVLGCLCMIEKFKPQICVISEFGEELSTLRIETAKALETQARNLKFSTDIRCIAGDVGLWLNPLNKTSLCYQTGEKISWKDLHSDINQDENSIFYVNRNEFFRLYGPVRKKTSIMAQNGMEIIGKLRKSEIVSDYNLDFDPNNVMKADIISLLPQKLNNNRNWPNPNDRLGMMMLLTSLGTTPSDLLPSLWDEIMDFDLDEERYFLSILEWLEYDLAEVIRKYASWCWEIANTLSKSGKVTYKKREIVSMLILSQKPQEILDSTQDKDPKSIEKAKKLFEELMTKTDDEILSLLMK
jgi:L-ascorbate metabolism protein UlaG (beta-lactamase superfamily)